MAANLVQGIPYALFPNPTFATLQGMNLYRRPILARYILV